MEVLNIIKSVKSFLRPSAFILFFAALTGIMAVTFYNASQKALAAPDSILYFEPATKSVGVNEDFTLDVMINPGANQVTGVSVRISYDPSKFRLDSISNAGSPFTVPLSGSSINNNSGTASADFGVSAGGSLVTSISKVATLSFHSLGAVAGSSIAFTADGYATASGEVVDIIKTRTAAAVTVNAATYSNADFADLAADWLKTGSSRADVNSDGVVNSRDLGIMMSSWQ